MPKVTLPEVELFFEVHGEGEALVFLHGLGAGTWTWEAQVNHFAQNYQVWVPELRGHGRSDKPQGPYSIELFAQDVVSFLESQKLSEVHLVGLSMGGIVAFQVAIERPDLVKSLSIVNCGPEIKADDFYMRCLMWQREWFMSFFSMQTISQMLAFKLFPESAQRNLRERFIENWAKNDKSAYQASFEAMVKWKGGDQPEKVHCPVLFMTTPNDYTPISMKKDYIARMEDARLAVIERSRHVTPLDQPEEFNEVLEAFLTEIEELVLA